MQSLLSLKKCRCFLPCSANRKKLYIRLAIAAGVALAAIAVVAVIAVKTYVEASV